MKTSRLFLCFVLSFVAMAFVACKGDTTNVTNELPTDPGATATVNIAGTARGGATSVEVEDSSTTSPAGHVELVSFVLRNAAGKQVAVIDVPKGCSTASTRPCVYEFGGLAAGTYSVSHTVRPDDGGPVASAIYSDLVVTGAI